MNLIDRIRLLSKSFNDRQVAAILGLTPTQVRDARKTGAVPDESAEGSGFTLNFDCWRGNPGINSQVFHDEPEVPLDHDGLLRDVTGTEFLAAGERFVFVVGTPDEYEATVNGIWRATHLASGIVVTGQFSGQWHAEMNATEQTPVPIESDGGDWNTIFTQQENGLYVKVGQGSTVVIQAQYEPTLRLPV